VRLISKYRVSNIFCPDQTRAPSEVVRAELSFRSLPFKCHIQNDLNVTRASDRRSDDGGAGGSLRDSNKNRNCKWPELYQRQCGVWCVGKPAHGQGVDARGSAHVSLLVVVEYHLSEKVLGRVCQGTTRLVSNLDRTKSTILFGGSVQSAFSCIDTL
jgi:hypothetical protein